MKQIRLSILLLLLTFSIQFVSAQSELSLDSCRSLAIENNKSLKIASQQERVAYYQKKEAFTKFLPELNATGAYMRLFSDLNLFPESMTLPSIGGLPSLEIPIPEEIGKLDTKNVYVGRVALTQPIFMGGRIIAYNDIRKNAELLAKSQKDTQLQEVITEIDAAYWQVVSLSWKKKLADSYVELLQKMESDVITMNQEGVATKADILTVSVKLNEAEMTLTKVNNGLSLSRMLLNQLCGLDVNMQHILADENKDLLPTDESIELSIPNIEEAINNRSEIKSLTIANEIYKAKEKVELADFLPQVGLTGGYLITNPSLHRGFAKEFYGSWSVGVVVKIPFSLGNFSKLKAAKAETIINQLKLEDAKQKIELQINQDTYKLNEAYTKLTAANKNMSKAEENLRYAQAGFAEGVIPSSDVLAAQTAWLQAKSELIDAKIDIKLCSVYLNKSLGKTL